MKSEKAKIVQVFCKSNKKLKAVLTTLWKIIKKSRDDIVDKASSQKYLSKADKGRGLETGDA